nr:MAG TPA: hypothetical protein [Caudoviricetes sp.]DAL12917.1 MAG TPA_asm: hypothetical protein [Caudoviricetes sp.]DAW00316.1 MAG TPA: hypothetical protein [Caudoviricetes sp.]
MTTTRAAAISCRVSYNPKEPKRNEQLPVSH